VTANPAIFEKAIVESNEYDDELARSSRPAAPRWKSTRRWPLATCAPGATCCVRSSTGWAGRTASSRSRSPPSSRATPGRPSRRPIGSGRRWIGRTSSSRSPATGSIPAIREATAAGISVNITLIFSNTVYQQVIDAYMAGLEDRLAKGLPVSQIHSVASFFVSRVDTAVDKLLEQKGEKSLLARSRGQREGGVPGLPAASRRRAGSAAGERRHPAEALVASTGTKNKAYSDVLYVER